MNKLILIVLVLWVVNDRATLTISDNNVPCSTMISLIIDIGDKGLEWSDIWIGINQEYVSVPTSDNLECKTTIQDRSYG